MEKEGCVGVSVLAYSLWQQHFLFIHPLSSPFSFPLFVAPRISGFAAQRVCGCCG